MDYYREVMERIRAKNTDVIINLTAGTQVSLMLNEAVDGESVAIGNALDFSVRSNVVKARCPKDARMGIIQTRQSVS